MSSLKAVDEDVPMRDENLELRFHDEMLGIYRRAKSECRYNAARFPPDGKRDRRIRDRADLACKRYSFRWILGSMAMWTARFDGRGSCAQTTMVHAVYD